MRVANSFICLPFCACSVSLCLFIVYIAHLFGRLTFFAAGTETETTKGPLPASSVQSAQAVFPCLLTPFVCSTFCCCATHTLCHLPTDIARYKAVQAKPILIQLRVSPTHSNTHTHAHTCRRMKINGFLLRKKLSMVSECGLKQTFAFHCISQGAELHSDNRMIRRRDGTNERATDHY